MNDSIRKASPLTFLFWGFVMSIISFGFEFIFIYHFIGTSSLSFILAFFITLCIEGFKIKLLVHAGLTNSNKPALAYAFVLLSVLATFLFTMDSLDAPNLDVVKDEKSEIINDLSDKKLSQTTGFFEKRRSEQLEELAHRKAALQEQLNNNELPSYSKYVKSYNDRKDNRNYLRSLRNKALKKIENDTTINDRVKKSRMDSISTVHNSLINQRYESDSKQVDRYEKLIAQEKQTLLSSIKNYDNISDSTNSQIDTLIANSIDKVIDTQRNGMLALSKELQTSNEVHNKQIASVLKQLSSLIYDTTDYPRLWYVIAVIFLSLFVTTIVEGSIWHAFTVYGTEMDLTKQRRGKLSNENYGKATL